MAKKIREEGEKRVKKQGDEIFTCPFLSPLLSAFPTNLTNSESYVIPYKLKCFF